METAFLTPTEKELLIKGVEQDLQQLDTDIKNLYQRREDLQSLLKKLKKNNDTPGKGREASSFLKKYDLTWKRVCLASLNTVDTFQTTAEVYDFVVEHYPEAKDAEKSRTVASLSWSLSQLSESGEVVRIEKKFTKGNIWGLSVWFDKTTGDPYEKYRAALVHRGVPDFKLKPK